MQVTVTVTTTLTRADVTDASRNKVTMSAFLKLPILASVVSESNRLVLAFAHCSGAIVRDTHKTVGPRQSPIPPFTTSFIPYTFLISPSSFHLLFNIIMRGEVCIGSGSILSYVVQCVLGYLSSMLDVLATGSQHYCFSYFCMCVSTLASSYHSDTDTLAGRPNQYLSRTTIHFTGNYFQLRPSVKPNNTTYVRLDQSEYDRIPVSSIFHRQSDGSH